MTSINTLLLATDFSEGSIKATEYAKELASLTGAKIIIVNVIIPPTSSDYTTSLLMAQGVDIKKLDHDAMEEIGEELSKFVDKYFKDSGLDTAYYVARGDNYDGAIIKEAQDNAADIIIMGTHGRTGLKHAFIGSVAEKVVRTSPVPVLTVNVKE